MWRTYVSTICHGDFVAAFSVARCAVLASPLLLGFLRFHRAFQSCSILPVAIPHCLHATRIALEGCEEVSLYLCSYVSTAITRIEPLVTCPVPNKAS